MATVRALQLTFYKPCAEGKSGDSNTDSSNTTSTTATNAGRTTIFDGATGKFLNLPLWRAPWQEVPGRSNVLNVHDPIYTSMFESILYQSSTSSSSVPSPRYFGHLYLEGGSRNLSPKVTDEKYQLKNWRGERYSDDRPKTTSNKQQFDRIRPGQDPHESSAVLGCLMQIQDYRRMSDGRLLLLVHATERFVVSNVVQDLPYSIADVQLLPDLEELKIDATNERPTTPEEIVELPESTVATVRAKATQESIRRYHPYEYDGNHQLQLPNGPKVGVRHVSYDSITKVLPYCPFSSSFDASQATEITSDNAAASDAVRSEDTNHCLEKQLWRRGIFQLPPSDPEYMDQVYRTDSSDVPPKDLSSDELEQKLWLELNHYWITTQKQISPILLSLLPPDPVIPWPDDFVLHRIVESIVKRREHGLCKDEDEESIDVTGIDSSIRLGLVNDFRRIHPEYPAHRRQRRLSFSAAYLLEAGDEPDKTQRLRAQLLSIPSTQQRLKVVLERFLQWQAQKQDNLGVFE
ncbi:ATP-dependent protease La LON substrate-binding domain containing protein [Nitzschia inconspicua]|uniref:ATP-dependent protease La LON substrate-binding domain containing protein n=1 Tax=Nitzschia inconspicua TaxID=303405 RepID=A0A9K3PYR7_9STRA|nr:ATP-dependent protease La LON substrate-binding domain containing protein [Nitzschia inconspicua]